MIHVCNMRNYTIFRYQYLLLAYFEYVGNNFAADMSKMANIPKTREWWTHTEPMQEPVEGRATGEWWATMTELFHTD